MKELFLVNARIVTSKNIFAGDVLVKNGKIVKISQRDLKSSAVSSGRLEVIDLKGKYLLPGLIDAHVHFRTPGFTGKEDWLTGSKAALAGGVTTVLDMPNTKPPTTDAETLKKKREMILSKTLVNFGLYAGATAENVKKVMKLKNIAGVKIFMGSSTGNLLIDNKQILEDFFAEAAKANKLLAIHAESEACLVMKNAELRMKNGSDGLLLSDPAIHSRVRSPECAIEAVKEALHLAKKYGTRVHICHVSTEGELEVIRKFKTDKVSAEVTPHHLFLTEKDYEQYGNLVKVNPPLRGLIDQAALWEALKTGLVDMVATDHAPHLLEEKKLPYLQAPSGLPGVQTMLPLLLHAVNEGKLSLEKVVELTSTNPAKRFGMRGKGVIEEGADADFTIVDLGMVEKVCHHYLWTKVNWSPFHGWYLKGWPVMTFVGGELMYEWRDRFGEKRGREIKFG